MAKASKKSPEEKLRGELSVAATARRAGVAEQTHPPQTHPPLQSGVDLGIWFVAPLFVSEVRWRPDRQSGFGVADFLLGATARSAPRVSTRPGVIHFAA